MFLLFQYKSFLVVGVWITVGQAAPEFHSSFFLFAVDTFLFLACGLCVWHIWGLRGYIWWNQGKEIGRKSEESFLVHLFYFSRLYSNFDWLVRRSLSLFEISHVPSQFTSLTHTHRHSSQVTTHWEANKGDTILTSRHKNLLLQIVAWPALMSPEQPKLKAGLKQNEESERLSGTDN